MRSWKPKDKLFVNPYGWNSEPSREDEVVYIRKDVLLEWAKETYLTENASAIRKICFKQLIDKLNEM